MEDKLLDNGGNGTHPDLGTQLEDLITHVIRCEDWQRLEDRIDLALKVRRETVTPPPFDLGGV
ncbi:MAG: hypothetical protein NVS9B1_22140 [Candidatus Dormibacteraceae bacterium]